MPSPARPAVEPAVEGNTPPSGTANGPVERPAAVPASLSLLVLSRLGVPVVVGWLIGLVGLVVVAVGYFKVSGTDDIAEQLAYFSSASVGGLALLALAGLLIFSYHYREVARTNTALLAHLEGRAGTPSGMYAPTGHHEAVSVLQVGDTRTYHDPGCVFAAGRLDVTPLTPRAAVERGLRPCQVCAPPSS